MLDVVIGDIRMPKINGLDALVYCLHAYPHVPLIVLTGYPDTEMAISYLREGLVDYLVKPVDRKRLKAAGWSINFPGRHHETWDTLDLRVVTRRESAVEFFTFSLVDPIPCP